MKIILLTAFHFACADNLCKILKFEILSSSFIAVSSFKARFISDSAAVILPVSS